MASATFILALDDKYMAALQPAEERRWSHTQPDKVNQHPEEVEHLIALKDMSLWAASFVGPVIYSTMIMGVLALTSSFLK